MSDETTDTMDSRLFQLVLSLQAGAMHQMGKIVSPITGEIERDLDMARSTIDMLDMLEKKTKGNLTDDEAKFIAHVLYELRLNYVDEVKKSDSEAARKDDSGQPSAKEQTPEKPDGSDNGQETEK